MRVQKEVWLHKHVLTHVTTCETPLLHLEQAQWTFWVPKARCEQHVDTFRMKASSLLGCMPWWIISLFVFPPFPWPALSTALWTWQQGEICITSKTLALGLEAPRHVVRGCSRPPLNSSRTSSVPAVEANRLSYCANREWIIKKKKVQYDNGHLMLKWGWCQTHDRFLLFLEFLYHVYRAYRDIYDNTV